MTNLFFSTIGDGISNDRETFFILGCRSFRSV